MRKYFFFFFIICFCKSATIFAQEKGYPIKEYLSQINISDISVSPDGNQIAIITRQDNFDINKTEYKLWYSKIDNEGIVEYKEEVPIFENTVSNLQWTNDSKFLMFKSKDTIGKSLFKIDVKTPKKVTSVLKKPENLKNLSYYTVLKNNTILFTEPVTTSDSKDTDRVMKFPIVKSSHSTVIKQIDYKTGKIDSLFTIPFNVYNFEVSPDQNKLMYANVSSSKYYGSDYFKDVHTYIVDLDSGNLFSQLTNDMLWDTSKWLSNGNVLTSYTGDLELNVYTPNTTFFISDTDTKNKKQILKNFDGEVDGLEEWNSNQLLIRATLSTNSNFFVQDIKDNTLKQVTNFRGSITNLTISQNKHLIAFSMISDQNFEEVYVARSIDGLKKPIKITNFNKNLSKYPTTEIEKITWKNTNKDIIEGVLLWPPGKKGEKGLPLAVDIHGGPWSSRSEAISLSGMHFYYYHSLLASKGFLVFLPNYSGSTGRGKKFIDAIVGKPRTQPTDDILTGVDYIIDTKYVNKDEMIVKGASYGGLLTNSIIGETTMFKAALPSCGTWNELSEFGTNDGDISSFVLYDEIDVWENLELYIKESSVYNAKKIKTPTLITHGEKDVRVPTANAYAMYYTLKGMGVPVELLIYKNEGHVYQQPINKLAKVTAELEFMSRYVKPN